MSEIELLNQFEKEFDKQLCYELSCEARDCSECEIFLDYFGEYRNERKTAV